MASYFFPNKVYCLLFPYNRSKYELGLEVIIKLHGHRHNCDVSLKHSSVNNPISVLLLNKVGFL